VGDWYLTKRAREADDLNRGYFRLRDDASDAAFDIEGVFHPHLPGGPGSWPIEIPEYCLGQTYLTRIAGYYAELSLPRTHPTTSTDRNLVAPQFSMLSENHNWSQWSFPSEPEFPKWGRHGGGPGDGGDAIARDFRLAVASGGASPKDVAQDVHAAIGSWWRLVKAWLELLSGHDLEGLDRFYWSDGNLTLWDTAGRHLSQPSGVFVRQAFRPSMGFGAVSAIAMAVHAAGCEHEPPPEWELLRESMRAIERGQYRRATVEAATATEIALTTAIREAGREPAYMFGKVLGQAASLSLLDPDLLGQVRQYVSQPRNAAVHEGTPASNETANVAFDVALQCVQRLSPREALTEPYGLVLR
jgi:hypothetical protein